jgi:hypothetical protein
VLLDLLMVGALDNYRSDRLFPLLVVATGDTSHRLAPRLRDRWAPSIAVEAGPPGWVAALVDEAPRRGSRSLLLSLSPIV